MRRTSYTDSVGRRWAVLLPDDFPDSLAHEGLHIGPPSLEALGLPQDLEVRLHNALHDRQLFTAVDVKARRNDVLGALFATFRLDVSRVIDLYLNDTSEHTLSASTSPETFKEDQA